MKTIFLKCIFSKPFFASIYLSLNGSMWLRPRKNYFSEFSEAVRYPLVDMLTSSFVLVSLYLDGEIGSVAIFAGVDCSDPCIVW